MKPTSLKTPVSTYGGPCNLRIPTTCSKEVTASDTEVAANENILKHYGVIGIGLPSKCFLHSQFCQQSNSIAGSAATNAGIFCLDDIPMHNIENMFKKGMQENLKFKTLWCICKIHALNDKVIYKMHAPKLLHLGALAFDRWRPWWSKVVLALHPTTVRRTTQKNKYQMTDESWFSFSLVKVVGWESATILAQ